MLTQIPEKTNDQTPVTEMLSDLGHRPKPSEHKPKEYLLNLAKRIQDENESIRSKLLVQQMYLMCRRHRSLNVNDRFGFWRNGRWRESPDFTSLHGNPLFQALIRGAEANSVQTDIRLNFEVRANTTENRAVKKIAKLLYDSKRDELWSEKQRQTAFYAMILKLNAFYISRFNKDNQDIQLPLPSYAEVEYEQSGKYLCLECYDRGDYSPVNEKTHCQKCQSENITLLDDVKREQEELLDQFKLKPSGFPEMIISDAFDFSADPNGRPADIASCGWAEYRTLLHKNQLKREHPTAKLKGKAKWGYHTRVKQALKRFEAGECYPETDFDKQMFELRQIWLDRTEYADYVPPTNFKVGDYEFKRGIPLQQDFPDGLVFGIVNDEILFIHPENKNDHISSSIWLSDGISFYGIGASAGVPIQQKINQLDTIAMEGEIRATTGSAVYNPNAIDGASLEGRNTNIPMRPDFADEGRPINHFMMPLNLSGLSADSVHYASTQADAMQKILGIPDVTLGEDPESGGDKTFGGQRLRTRNALGLLAPSTKSVAYAMEQTMMHQLLLCQRYLAPEAMAKMGTMYGTTLGQDEIEAFYSADLKQVLRINYIQGTEVPESRFEKQVRLRQDIASGFIPLTPQIQAEIAKGSGFEVDINQFESNRKLGEKRYNLLKESITPEMDQAFSAIEAQMYDPNTGVRITDETGNPVVNPVVAQVMNLPALEIYEMEENHVQMQEFWADKVRTLSASSSEESPMLIQLAVMMGRRHTESAFKLQLKQTTLEGLTQMPAEAGRQAIGEGEGQQENNGQQNPPANA